MPYGNIQTFLHSCFFKKHKKRKKRKITRLKIIHARRCTRRYNFISTVLRIDRSFSRDNTVHRSSTCFVRRRFRRGFAQFFFWCPWVRVTREPSLSRSEAVTSRYSCTGSPDMHRISRNGTCIFSEHTCTTGSTTPRSESESHSEDTDPDQGDARTSSIDLRHLVPDVLDRGNVVAARNCTSHWSPRNSKQSLHLTSFNPPPSTRSIWRIANILSWSFARSRPALSYIFTDSTRSVIRT